MMVTRSSKRGCATMRGSAIVASVLVLLGMSLRTPVAAESAHPYSGDFFTRSTFTGDFNGDRNDLASKGVTFDASLTQIGQGVVDGGKDGTWEYGGRGKIATTVDSQKMGLWPGGFLNVELEGNWSDSINGKTGGLSPANTNQLFPVPGGDNFAVPQLNVMQFLSHYFGLTAGKYAAVTSVSGDMNEFAHGRGDTNFLNTAFNVNPVLLLTVPYSTLGAGVIALPTKDPHEAIVSFLVVSAEGKASTDGFDNLSSDNLTFAGEGRVRTGFFDLTGHQVLGANYANREYSSLDQRIQFDPIGGALGRTEPPGIAKKDGAWSLNYNFDQFLLETNKDKGQGIGLFGRFGASGGNPNPMHYFYSAGVGGKGMIPGRPLDRFGIGYYYLNIDNPKLALSKEFHDLEVTLASRSLFRDEWGFEAFYNIAITPWLLLTPDLQVIGPAQKSQIVHPVDPTNLATKSVDLATVLGFRVQLIF